MEFLILIVALIACTLWLTGGWQAIGELIERHIFIPAYARYQRDGGTLTGRGEIVRANGEIVPFVMNHRVRFTESTLSQAMARVAKVASPWRRMSGVLAHSAATRNAMADLVVDALDVGGTGTFQLQTSGQVEVATLTYGTPAYGNAAAGVATANAITPDTNATGGVAAESHHFNGSAVEVFSSSVGATGSGEDIELTSTTIGATDTVSMSALSYAAPA